MVYLYKQRLQAYHLQVFPEIICGEYVSIKINSALGAGQSDKEKKYSYVWETLLIKHFENLRFLIFLEIKVRFTFLPIIIIKHY